MRHAIVTLNVPRRDNDIIRFARSVALAMTDNPYLPSPTPSVPELQALIAAAEEAQAWVLIGPIGAASARDAKIAALWGALEHLRSHVQFVADRSPGEAHVIIASAGMRVKRPGLHDKPALEVRQGRVSGSARLSCQSAGDRATYEWQWAKKGESFLDAEPTRQSKTTLYEFTPGLEYEFRVRSVTKGGRSDFGDVVSFRVL